MTIAQVKLKSSGDTSLLVEFEPRVDLQTARRVQGLARRLQSANVPGVLEWVSGYCTLLIEYDPRVLAESQLRSVLTTALEQQEQQDGDEGEKPSDSNSVPGSSFPPDSFSAPEQSASSGPSSSVRLVAVPVCYGIYGDEFGPDLETVARANNLSPEEVVRLHSEVNYYIYFTGFLPSFPFLGGMLSAIATPRLGQPRTRVPAGSVGIAGEQTGIYPVESPGGWQLIGRTPVSLFDLRREDPFVFKAGDWLRFEPISAEEFSRLSEENAEWPVQLHMEVLDK